MSDWEKVCSIEIGFSGWESSIGYWRVDVVIFFYEIRKLRGFMGDNVGGYEVNNWLVDIII